MDYCQKCGRPIEEKMRCPVNKEKCYQCCREEIINGNSEENE